MRAKKSMKTVSLSFSLSRNYESVVYFVNLFSFIFLATSVDKKKMKTCIVSSGQKIDPLPRAKNKHSSSFIFF